MNTEEIDLNLVKKIRSQIFSGDITGPSRTDHCSYEIYWLARCGRLPPGGEQIGQQSFSENVITAVFTIGFLSVEELDWHLMNLRNEPVIEKDGTARSKISTTNQILTPIDRLAGIVTHSGQS